MSEDDFRGLASGRGSASAVEQLIDGQRTLRRALLTAVYQAANTDAALDQAMRTRLRAAWSVLSVVDTEHPGALERVLGHPFARLWAARCLSQLESSAAALGADLDYLSALAASSAILAGIAAEISVPIADGVLLLPTIGRLVVKTDQPEITTAHLAVDGDRVQFRVGEDWWKLAISDMLRGDTNPVLVGDDRRAGEWQPVRFLRTGEVSVVLEDADPFRDCYVSSVLPHLPSAEFADWQRAFECAWAEIEASYSEYIPAIKAGLTALVPLASAPRPDGSGAAERHAFGVIAIAPLADPAHMGRSIVAAFQRAKFGAIIDLFDLVDPDASDGRSAGRQLEEAYVELAVGDKRAVGDAIEALADRDVLTPEGRRFVAEMHRSAQALGQV